MHDREQARVRAQRAIDTPSPSHFLHREGPPGSREREKKERKRESRWDVVSNLGPPKRSNQRKLKASALTTTPRLLALFFCKNDPLFNKILNNSEQKNFRICPFWAAWQQPVFTNGPYHHLCRWLNWPLKNLSKLAPFAGGP